MLLDNRLHIVFFYGNLQTGGIQTLIVRLSNWLVYKNIRVTLFLENSGELMHLLDNRVEKIVSGKKNIFFSSSFFKKYYPDLLASKIDAVLSFDIPSLIVAILFYGSYKKPLHFINGVYHPDALEKELSSLSRGDVAKMDFLLHVYDNILNDNSKIFMNHEVSKKVQNLIGRKIPSVKILPLPINISPVRDLAQQAHKSRKIISVGRLTRFKTYNLYLLDVIAELKHDGIECHWSVYGQGELEQNMLSKIFSLGISDNVTLHGKLPYEQLASTLDDAFLYIGMGTSIIEAGSRGLPVIPAIVDYGPYTYGYLYELPENHLGELLDFPPEKPVILLLKKLLSLNGKDYISECKKTREYCLRYDINKLGEKYLDHFQNSGKSEGLLLLSASDEFNRILKSYRIKLIRIYVVRQIIIFLKWLLPERMINFARSKILMTK